MTKLTKEKIGQIVLENIESAELEAIEELTQAITKLADNVENLTLALANKPLARPIQTDIISHSETVLKTQEVLPATPKTKKKRVVEPVVESVVEPVVEPVVESVVQPVVESVVQPVVQPVVEQIPHISLVEFTTLFEQARESVTKKFGEDKDAKVIELARSVCKEFKVEKFSHIPDDRLGYCWTVLLNTIKTEFNID